MKNTFYSFSLSSKTTKKKKKSKAINVICCKVAYPIIINNQVLNLCNNFTILLGFIKSASFSIVNDTDIAKML